MYKILFVIIISIFSTALGILVDSTFFRELDGDSGHNQDSNSLKIEFLNPELFVVPIINSKELYGYMGIRLVFVVDSSHELNEILNEDVLLSDVFYQKFFKSNIFASVSENDTDLSLILNSIITELNMYTKESRYIGAYVQQFDIFNRNEVRRKVVEDRFSNTYGATN